MFSQDEDDEDEEDFNPDEEDGDDEEDIDEEEDEGWLDEQSSLNHILPNIGECRIKNVLWLFIYSVVSSW